MESSNHIVYELEVCMGNEHDWVMGWGRKGRGNMRYIMFDCDPHVMVLINNYL